MNIHSIIAAKIKFYKSPFFVPLPRLINKEVIFENKLTKVFVLEADDIKTNCPEFDDAYIPFFPVFLPSGEIGRFDGHQGAIFYCHCNFRNREGRYLRNL